MVEITDKSIQSVITSPPYFNLKDYGHPDQIGVGDSSYDEYQSRLSAVWSECYTKIVDGGSMWIVADTFTDKEGKMRLLPQHLVDNLSEIGFQHEETIVWHKPTSLGGMNPKVLVNKKEYVLLLSKGPDLKFNPDIQCGNGLEDPGITGDGKLGNVWRFPVKRGSLGENVLHKAPFPIDLVKRMIRLSTGVGDCVLDPFLGSGTTACASIELDRDPYGYEINEAFKSITENRINSHIG